MQELSGRKILFFQQRKWGKNIGHFLAQRLSAEGCRLAAITLKRTTHEFTVNQKEVSYELIINNDAIMSSPKDYLQGDSFSLKEICTALGVRSVWPLIMSLRNHVRSYKDKFYYGFRQNVSDEEIIAYVQALYKCITVVFHHFRPEVILTPNFVALPHIMFNLYATQQQVPMIGISDVKVNDVFIFVHDYNECSGSFYDRIDSLNNGTATSANLTRAQEYIQTVRKSGFSRKKVGKKKSSVIHGLTATLKRELLPLRQIVAWYRHPQKNVLQSTGITLDYRPPRIIFRDHICRKRYAAYMNSFPYFPLNSVGPFVYFPLQFQPEETIDVKAPFFSNQIETARQVAMALPDDFVLVVKEHPAMIGLRPPSYIDKIARTPNVKCIDYRIPSEKILKRCSLVISPNSTTIAEGAFYHKPVIQLGNLGTTLKLPNVRRHTDMTTLGEKIRETLSIDLKTLEYEKRLENYVAAAYDTGLELDYLRAWGKGDKEVLEKLWALYKREITPLLRT